MTSNLYPEIEYNAQSSPIYGAKYKSLAGQLVALGPVPQFDLYMHIKSNQMKLRQHATSKQTKAKQLLSAYQLAGIYNSGNTQLQFIKFVLAYPHRSAYITEIVNPTNLTQAAKLMERAFYCGFEPNEFIKYFGITNHQDRMSSYYFKVLSDDVEQEDQMERDVVEQFAAGVRIDFQLISETIQISLTPINLFPLNMFSEEHQIRSRNQKIADFYKQFEEKQRENVDYSTLLIENIEQKIQTINFMYSRLYDCLHIFDLFRKTEIIQGGISRSCNITERILFGIFQRCIDIAEHYYQIGPRAQPHTLKKLFTTIAQACEKLMQFYARCQIHSQSSTSLIVNMVKKVNGSPVVQEKRVFKAQTIQDYIKHNQDGMEEQKPNQDPVKELKQNFQKEYDPTLKKAIDQKTKVSRKQMEVYCIQGYLQFLQVLSQIVVADGVPFLWSVGVYCLEQNKIYVRCKIQEIIFLYSVLRKYIYIIVNYEMYHCQQNSQIQTAALSQQLSQKEIYALKNYLNEGFIEREEEQNQQDRFQGDTIPFQQQQVERAFQSDNINIDTFRLNSQNMIESNLPEFHQTFVRNDNRYDKTVGSSVPDQVVQNAQAKYLMKFDRFKYFTKVLSEFDSLFMIQKTKKVSYESQSAKFTPLPNTQLLTRIYTKAKEEVSQFLDYAALFHIYYIGGFNVKTKLMGQAVFSYAMAIVATYVTFCYFYEMGEYYDENVFLAEVMNAYNQVNRVVSKKALAQSMKLFNQNPDHKREPHNVYIDMKKGAFILLSKYMNQGAELNDVINMMKSNNNRTHYTSALFQYNISNQRDNCFENAKYMAAKLIQAYQANSDKAMQRTAQLNKAFRRRAQLTFDMILAQSDYFSPAIKQDIHMIRHMDTQSQPMTVRIAQQYMKLLQSQTNYLAHKNKASFALGQFAKKLQSVDDEALQNATQLIKNGFNVDNFVNGMKSQGVLKVSFIEMVHQIYKFSDDSDKPNLYHHLNRMPSHMKEHQVRRFLVLIALGMYQNTTKFFCRDLTYRINREWAEHLKLSSSSQIKHALKQIYQNNIENSMHVLSRVDRVLKSSTNQFIDSFYIALKKTTPKQRRSQLNRLLTIKTKSFRSLIQSKLDMLRENYNLKNQQQVENLLLDIIDERKNRHQGLYDNNFQLTKQTISELSNQVANAFNSVRKLVDQDIYFKALRKIINQNSRGLSISDLLEQLNIAPQVLFSPQLSQDARITTQFAVIHRKLRLNQQDLDNINQRIINAKGIQQWNEQTTKKVTRVFNQLKSNYQDHSELKDQTQLLQSQQRANRIEIDRLNSAKGELQRQNNVLQNEKRNLMNQRYQLDEQIKQMTQTIKNNGNREMEKDLTTKNNILKQQRDLNGRKIDDLSEKLHQASQKIEQLSQNVEKCKMQTFQERQKVRMMQAQFQKELKIRYKVNMEADKIKFEKLQGLCENYEQVLREVGLDLKNMTIYHDKGQLKLGKTKQNEHILRKVYGKTTTDDKSLLQSISNITSHSVMIQIFDRSTQVFKLLAQRIRNGEKLGSIQESFVLELKQLFVDALQRSKSLLSFQRNQIFNMMQQAIQPEQYQKKLDFLEKNVQQTKQMLVAKDGHLHKVFRGYISASMLNFAQNIIKNDRGAIAGLNASEDVFSYLVQNGYSNHSKVIRFLTPIVRLIKQKKGPNVQQLLVDPKAKKHFSGILRDAFIQNPRLLQGVQKQMKEIKQDIAKNETHTFACMHLLIPLFEDLIYQVQLQNHSAVMIKMEGNKKIENMNDKILQYQKYTGNVIQELMVVDTKKNSIVSSLNALDTRLSELKPHTKQMAAVLQGVKQCINIIKVTSNNLTINDLKQRLQHNNLKYEAQQGGFDNLKRNYGKRRKDFLQNDEKKPPEPQIFTNIGYLEAAVKELDEYTSKVITDGASRQELNEYIQRSKLMQNQVHRLNDVIQEMQRSFDFNFDIAQGRSLQIQQQQKGQIIQLQNLINIDAKLHNENTHKIAQTQNMLKVANNRALQLLEKLGINMEIARGVFNEGKDFNTMNEYYKNLYDHLQSYLIRVNNMEEVKSVLQNQNNNMKLVIHQLNQQLQQANRLTERAMDERFKTEVRMEQIQRQLQFQTLAKDTRDFKKLQEVLQPLNIHQQVPPNAFLKRKDPEPNYRTGAFFRQEQDRKASSPKKNNPFNGGESLRQYERQQKQRLTQQVQKKQVNRNNRRSVSPMVRQQTAKQVTALKQQLVKVKEQLRLKAQQVFSPKDSYQMRLLQIQLQKKQAMIQSLNQIITQFQQLSGRVTGTSKMAIDLFIEYVQNQASRQRAPAVIDRIVDIQSQIAFPTVPSHHLVNPNLGNVKSMRLCLENRFNEDYQNNTKKMIDSLEKFKNISTQGGSIFLTPQIGEIFSSLMTATNEALIKTRNAQTNIINECILSTR